jgi:hypothetical protein
MPKSQIRHEITESPVQLTFRWLLAELTGLAAEFGGSHRIWFKSPTWDLSSSMSLHWIFNRASGQSFYDSFYQIPVDTWHSHGVQDWLTVELQNEYVSRAAWEALFATRSLVLATSKGLDESVESDPGLILSNTQTYLSLNSFMTVREVQVAPGSTESTVDAIAKALGEKYEFALWIIHSSRGPCFYAFESDGKGGLTFFSPQVGDVWFPLSSNWASWAKEAIREINGVKAGYFLNLGGSTLLLLKGPPRSRASTARAWVKWMFVY